MNKKKNENKREQIWVKKKTNLDADDSRDTLVSFVGSPFDSF